MRIIRPILYIQSLAMGSDRVLLTKTSETILGRSLPNSNNTIYSLRSSTATRVYIEII